jgi:predicted metalloprotease with PDZ domain
MDIGRLVSNFQAYDTSGNIVASQKVSTNQFEFSEPEKVAKISYEIVETFDTKLDSNPIYPMCGTSIEEDHALINGQAVFGYFKGRQASPIRVKINYPENWIYGTALSKDANGYFNAKNFDHIVDSPILLGNLSKASVKIGNSDIDIFTYSKTGLITSDSVLSTMEDMLISADKFVYGLPVNRYTFLYHFEDKDFGAWEHSYSSEYVLKEAEWGSIKQATKDIAAHEFFHIITPLNIHSEVVEQFNFVTPVPSKHLWLYEATTEWASHKMQLQAGQTTLDDYFAMLKRKVQIDNYFDPSYSLEKLALTSFTPEGFRQYGNIYYRGALVMGLIDIKLLELSNGKRGLREVINELSKEFGPNKPFKEATFYQDFVNRTYPEIGELFEKYIKNAEPLPYEDMYAKIGILYEAEKPGLLPSTTHIQLGMSKQGLIINNPNRQLRQFGFVNGDLLLEINNEGVTMENIRNLSERLNKLPVGSEYTIKVKRDSDEITVRGKTFSSVEKYNFSELPNATAQQLALRNAWMKQL